MKTDWNSVASILGRHDIRFYPHSVRQGEGFEVAFAKQDSHGFVVSMSPLSTPEPADAVLLEDVYLYPLDWHNYLALRDLLDLRPSVCTKPRSFGTGDRLGMVTAAHLRAFTDHDVFPVLAQQSPRELVRTGRDFRDVILSAVSGVLESGYTGRFGADADHIKHEQQLRQAIEAGYTMYTIDVSDRLRDVTRMAQPELMDKARALSPLSQSIIRDHADKPIRTQTGDSLTLRSDELLLSAITFEPSMAEVRRFSGILREQLPAFDLEVSIDECSRVTTPEDHLYVVEYLRRSEVPLWSLAVRFPGEFQKGVDYIGNPEELEIAFRQHAALCQELQGYRLSLHSGSDKFSVYTAFREATGDHFHVKTSGTSWLQAVRLIAQTDVDLFRELYRLCLHHFEESRQAYHVSINLSQFPKEPPAEASAFLSQPHVRQLFHISYGVLLEERGKAIRDLLDAHEQEHYRLVAEHIERHLQALQSVR